jgi:hypothetical protein
MQKKQLSNILSHNKKRKLAPMKCSTFEEIPNLLNNSVTNTLSFENIEELEEDPDAKDKYGTTKALR